MTTNIEKTHCITVQYRCKLNQVNETKPFFYSKKLLYQNNDIFRVGVKIFSEGHEALSYWSSPTIFFLTTNLKKLGLKVMAVNLTFEINKRKVLKVLEMDPAPGNQDENETCQLFTAQPMKDTGYDKTSANSIFTFTVYMTGISDSYRTCRVDGLLSQQLLSAVIDRNGTDFKLVSNDRRFTQVHKFILAARSPVFEALFGKEVGDHHDMDCTFHELNQFVKFIYVGELEGLVNPGLMQLATTYQIETLEDLCLVAFEKVPVNKMAVLALHLNPGYAKLCEVDNAPDTDLELEYDDNYISFFICTWNVQNLWTKEDQKIFKTSAPFQLGEEVLFQAELEIGRNPEYSNEEHTLQLKFLSHGHGKIGYSVEEVSYKIDQLNRISTKKTKMFEDPTHDKKLLQVFAQPRTHRKEYNTDIKLTSQFFGPLFITFQVKLRSSDPNLINRPIDSTWSEQLWAAAVDRKMTDVEFLVGEETFDAHRSILSARSPFFASMFASGMKEAETGQVRIQDVDPIVFQHFLKFLYTGMFEPSSIDRELFTVADKYQESTLMELCSPAVQADEMDNIISTFFSC